MLFGLSARGFDLGDQHVLVGVDHQADIEHHQLVQRIQHMLTKRCVFDRRSDQAVQHIFQRLHCRQVQLGINADALVHQPDAQAALDIIQVVNAAEQFVHVTALRGLQAFEGAGVRDQQFDFGKVGLQFVEFLNHIVDEVEDERTGLDQKARILVIELIELFALGNLHLGDAHLLEQRAVGVLGVFVGHASLPHPCR